MAHHDTELSPIRAGEPEWDYCSHSEGEQRQNLDYGPLLAIGVGVLVSGFWICALLYGGYLLLERWLEPFR
jgi:hypothetical protein